MLQVLHIFSIYFATSKALYPVRKHETHRQGQQPWLLFLQHLTQQDVKVHDWLVTVAGRCMWEATAYRRTGLHTACTGHTGSSAPQSLSSSAWQRAPGL